MNSSKFELDGLGPDGQGPFRVPAAQSVLVKEGSDAVELTLNVLHEEMLKQVLVTIPNRFGYQLASAFKRAAETEAASKAAKE
jgi:hypothetical protein